ncbi:YgfY [Klebsiella michiganensis]|uniref:FAD assembly factor SdhE n=2 Tax=Klebsiella TaxID=570 RepID=A0A7H4PI42_9ENTR|nr:YgfY [Klebsiella michiganensis]
MDINNKARIHWACRRGMRELDISIMPFFEHEYDTLSDGDKALFIRLLENDDPDLFNWLMNHGEPADAELQRMVNYNSDTESGTWSCGNLIYASRGERSGFRC